MNKLYLTTKGSGNLNILFLHGLWGGGNYFRYFDFVDTKESASFFPDELGFGKSPKPNIAYTPQAHCEALFTTLDQNKKYTIVAHSFGTILAVYFAHLYPQLVKKLILVSPLIYQTRPEAEKYLSHIFITKLTLKKPFLAKCICKTVCSTNILGLVAPFVVRNKKHAYIGGCTQHTWHSYYSTFMECGVKTQIFPLVKDLSKKIPTVLLYGHKDRYISQTTLQDLPKQIDQIQIDGGHDILFTSFDKSKEILEKHVK